VSPRVWRVVPADEAGDAFGGTDAAGRWNESGVRVVYASRSRSLALLEFLVHLEGEPGPLAAAPADLDEGVAEESVDETALPPGWQDRPQDPAVRSLGTGWLASARTVVLSVPSAVVPGERNVLLNPAHPDFARVHPAPPQPFELDPRLRGSEPQAPAIADGQSRSLDPRVVVLGRVTGGIAAAVLSLLLLLGGLIGAWLSGLSWTLVGVGALGWLLVASALTGTALVWPALEHRHTRYRVDPRALEIRRGVWWREVVNVPRSRVQHTDVSQGPVERAYGLATLVVHTAGTEHASVSLSGLPAAEAAQIRDFLIAGGGRDAV
jgi:membrane protein YdbS with pleckstrin-like domain/RES domain-containing protein